MSLLSADSVRHCDGALVPRKAVDTFVRFRRLIHQSTESVLSTTLRRRYETAVSVRHCGVGVVLTNSSVISGFFGNNLLLMCADPLVRKDT